jgi:hypothetical protein
MAAGLFYRLEIDRRISGSVVRWVSEIIEVGIEVKRIQ